MISVMCFNIIYFSDSIIKLLITLLHKTKESTKLLFKSFEQK